MRVILALVVVFSVVAVVVRDTSTASSTLSVDLLSRNMSGGPSSGAQCADVSADGRFVVFTSRDDQLVLGDTNNAEDVFLVDREAGLTSRVNLTHLGDQSAGDTSGCQWPRVTDDGHYVVFTSFASDLVPIDTNGHRDVFVRDLWDSNTVRVSVTSDGVEQNGSGTVYPADISADGRFVVFESGADNLAPDDFPGYDIFIHNRNADETGEFDDPGGITTELVSVSGSGEPGNDSSRMPVISDDGTIVAFISQASNLVPDDSVTCQDGNELSNCYDVFIRDLQTGTTLRASENALGEGGSTHSSQPAISPDGRLVAFASSASNLVPDDNNGATDVFLYDAQAESIEAVSLTPDGSLSAGPSCTSLFWFPCTSISADGSRVAFESTAQLIPEDTNCQVDIYVRDRAANSTTRVSVDANGNQLNGPSYRPVFAESSLVFASSATDIVPGLPDPTAQVYAVSDPAGTSGTETALTSQNGLPGICASPIGDVDCDLDVDAVDALKVLRFVANIGIQSDCLLVRGNVHCYWEPAINAVDALDILRYVARLLGSLPNCPPPVGGK